MPKTNTVRGIKKNGVYKLASKSLVFDWGKEMWYLGGEWIHYTDYKQTWRTIWGEIPKQILCWAQKKIECINWPLNPKFLIKGKLCCFPPPNNLITTEASRRSPLIQCIMHSILLQKWNENKNSDNNIDWKIISCSVIFMHLFPLSVYFIQVHITISK